MSVSASAGQAMIHLLPLAEVDDDKVTPGILGFVVFAVMAVAVWGLMKSMNRHMRRVEFKEQDAPQDGTSPAPTTPEQRKASAGRTK
ncbi:hypothetical protein [Streptomyces sp. NPDC007088]|uniref:hypothetical protein n=1 Tax=Streptomyces sp. NPDC007088 TaxID=3364773 RepID=UPI003674A5FE